MEAVEDKTYPIAEIFHSVQGEGGNSGRAMTFIRLAGCTVGKPYTVAQKQAMNLQIFQNECTIMDGRKFPCDTDYRAHRRLTVNEILNEVEQLSGTYGWISITGGEPLMHDLSHLLNPLLHNYSLHLETSGTIPLSKVAFDLVCFEHIVVSPKYPFQDEYVDFADEIRLLVDDQFNWDKLPLSIKEAEEREVVWISPVNFVDKIDMDNVRRCGDIIMKHPSVRVSLQIQKILGVR